MEKNVSGRDSLMVDTADQGEVVGASWLIPPYRWQFVGRASGQLGVVALDGACIRGKCEADTRLLFMKRLAEILLRRLHSTRFLLIDLYQHGPTR